MVDEKTGLPLWLKTHNGFLSDTTQNPFSLKKAVNPGFKKLYAIDGHSGKEDMEALEKQREPEFGVLCSEGPGG